MGEVISYNRFFLSKRYRQHLMRGNQRWSEVAEEECFLEWLSRQERIKKRLFEAKYFNYFKKATYHRIIFLTGLALLSLGSSIILCFNCLAGGINFFTFLRFCFELTLCYLIFGFCLAIVLVNISKDNPARLGKLLNEEKLWKEFKRKLK